MITFIVAVYSYLRAYISLLARIRHTYLTETTFATIFRYVYLTGRQKTAHLSHRNSTFTTIFRYVYLTARQNMAHFSHRKSTFNTIFRDGCVAHISDRRQPCIKTYPNFTPRNFRNLPATWMFCPSALTTSSPTMSCHEPAAVHRIFAKPTSM
jgi:hypothetical protein